MAVWVIISILTAWLRPLSRKWPIHNHTHLMYWKHCLPYCSAPFSFVITIQITWIHPASRKTSIQKQTQIHSFVCGGRWLLRMGHKVFFTELHTKLTLPLSRLSFKPILPTPTYWDSLPYMWRGTVKESDTHTHTFPHLKWQAEQHLHNSVKCFPFSHVSYSICFYLCIRIPATSALLDKVLMHWVLASPSCPPSSFQDIPF